MSIRKLFGLKKKNSQSSVQKRYQQQLERHSSTKSIDSECSSSSDCSDTSASSLTSTTSTSSRISFSDTIQVQEITPLSSLTNNPEELWYQQNEYEDIRTRIHRLAKYAGNCDKQQQQQKQEKQGKQGNEQKRQHQRTKKVCTRGLEWMMEETATAVHIHKNEARICVLTAQKLKLNDERIACLYKKVSRSSATWAQERATKDAKVVGLYISN